MISKYHFSVNFSFHNSTLIIQFSLLFLNTPWLSGYMTANQLTIQFLGALWFEYLGGKYLFYVISLDVIIFYLNETSSLNQANYLDNLGTRQSYLSNFDFYKFSWAYMFVQNTVFTIPFQQDHLFYIIPKNSLKISMFLNARGAVFYVASLDGVQHHLMVMCLNKLSLV